MKKSILLLCTAVMTLFFFSCEQKTVAASFVGTLDYIDTLIASNQVDEANKVLKTLSKHISTENQYLALSRRYIDLADFAQAESMLKKGLKEYPSNLELRAVLAHTLIRQNNVEKTEEALEVAYPLKGTKYGSFLAELVIQSTTDKSTYLSKDFIQYYIDAAHVTHDSTFLRNAALVYAINGEFQEAALLQPLELFYYEQPLFWAYIMYDAGNYSSALYDISLIDDSAETITMQADIFTYSAEYEKAYPLWQKIISDYPDFSPIAYTNASFYEHFTFNKQKQSDTLFNLVNKFPDYVPGLIEYAHFVVENSKPPQDDEMTAALRKSGAFSLSMEEDATFILPSIPDALKRVSDSLERTQDPQLFAESLVLQWQVESKTTQEKKNDLWFALEAHPENESINQLALWFFLYTNDKHSALQVFNSHLKRTYNTTDISSVIDTLSVWEAEFVAYMASQQLFTAYQEKEAYELAQKLYMRVFEEKKNTYSILMNVANMSNAANNSAEALLLYAQAVNYAVNSEDLAETHYRVAHIYADNADMRNASISLNYALSLDPGHTKARLLAREIGL